MIMQDAWKQAKHGAKKFGGNSKIYIAQAMKNAWKKHAAYMQKLALIAKAVKKAGSLDAIKVVMIDKTYFTAYQVNAIFAGTEEFTSDFAFTLKNVIATRF